MLARLFVLAAVVVGTSAHYDGGDNKLYGGSYGGGSYSGNPFYQHGVCSPDFLRGETIMAAERLGLQEQMRKMSAKKLRCRQVGQIVS